MKKTLKILYASLKPAGATDINGDYCEWEYTEVSEAEYGRSWDGDVKGYLENLDFSDPDNIEIVPVEKCGFTIHNEKFGGFVVMREGLPAEMYWVTDEDLPWPDYEGDEDDDDDEI